MKVKFVKLRDTSVAIVAKLVLVKGLRQNSNLNGAVK